MKQLNLTEPESITYKVLCGAGITKHTTKDWSKLSTDFADRNFPDQKEVIRNPAKKNCILNNIATIFEQWIDEGPGFVVTNYSSEEHCTFLGYDFNGDILKKLNIKPGSNFNNRLLMSNPKQKVLLNVRVIETDDMEEIQIELSKCADDLRILIAMNQEIFRGSGIISIGVVVANRRIQIDSGYNDIVCCADCDALTVTTKELQSVENFNTCWRETHLSHC